MPDYVKGGQFFYCALQKQTNGNKKWRKHSVKLRFNEPLCNKVIGIMKDKINRKDPRYKFKGVNGFF